MFATNPETQIEVERLTAALREVSIGAVITYDALSDALGVDVRSRPFSLMKARRAYEKDTGRRLETVRGVGIKAIAANDLAGIGAVARERIARSAKRQSERLSNLRYNDIDKSAQTRIDAERSLLGAISAVARTKPETIEPEAKTGPIVAAKIFERLQA